MERTIALDSEKLECFLRNITKESNGSPKGRRYKSNSSSMNCFGDVQCDTNGIPMGRLKGEHCAVVFQWIFICGINFSF